MRIEMSGWINICLGVCSYLQRDWSNPPCDGRELCPMGDCWIHVCFLISSQPNLSDRGFSFQYVIRRRHFSWWTKYNCRQFNCSNYMTPLSW